MPASADDLPTKPAFGMMDSTADGSELVVELATLIPWPAGRTAQSRDRSAASRVRAVEPVAHRCESGR
jgi:hypothetical protein